MGSLQKQKKSTTWINIFALLIFLIAIISGIYLVWDSNSFKKGIQQESGSSISKDEAIKLINECRIEAVRFYADEPTRVVLQQLDQNKKNNDYYVPSEDFDTLAEAFRLAADRCGLYEMNVSSEKYFYITEQKAKELLESCQQVYIITDEVASQYNNTLIQGTKSGIIWNYKEFPLLADEKEDSVIIIFDEVVRTKLIPIAQTATKTCPENTILF